MTRLATALLISVLAGCAAEPLTDSGVEALVWVDETGIDIDGVEAALRPELPTYSEHLVHWALRDESGDVLSEGDAPDPRWLRSETADDPETAVEIELAEVQRPGGLVPLFLPAVAGELVITDPDGVELGRTRYVPPMEGAARAPLLRPSDVRGRPVRVVHHGRKSEKIDLLFVAEGYRHSELGRFRDDVARLADGLRDQADYDGRRWDWFNVWRWNVQSRESGADDPDDGVRRNTAFDTSFGRGDDHRCIYPSTRAGETEAFELGRRMHADVVVVLVNSSEYGGCAGRVISMTRRSAAVRVLAHEMGHAVFGLADEYEYGGESCGHTRRVKVAPNISGTSDRERLPWSDLVERGTPVPTPESAAHGHEVGAFEGGSYCAHDRWRPQLSCLMRDLDHTMCAVCSRQMSRTMRRLRNHETRGGRTPDDTGPVCGDGVCDGDETCDVCEDDCGACPGSIHCGGAPSCVDDLGLERCEGTVGFLECPSGDVQACTCTAGDFVDCEPCP